MPTSITDDTDPRFLLSVDDVARAVSLSRSAIEGMIREGELAARYFGRKPLIEPSAIRDWINTLPAEKPKARD